MNAATAGPEGPTDNRVPQKDTPGRGWEELIADGEGLKIMEERPKVRIFDHKLAPKPATSGGSGVTGRRVPPRGRGSVHQAFAGRDDREELIASPVDVRTGELIRRWTVRAAQRFLAAPPDEDRAALVEEATRVTASIRASLAELADLHHEVDRIVGLVPAEFRAGLVPFKKLLRRSVDRALAGDLEGAAQLRDVAFETLDEVAR